MHIVTNFKLTWDATGTPLVLVDIGGKVTEEFSIGGSQDLQASKRLRAAGTKNFGRGGFKSGVSFGVLRDFDTDALARDFIVDHTIVMQGLVLKTRTLTLQNKNGSTYRMSECVYATHTTAKIPFGREGKSRVRIDYSFDGSTWTKL